MKVIGDKIVLNDAQRALSLIHESLTDSDRYGAIDAVLVGLRAMATTLLNLFDFPISIRDDIDTVHKALAYMAVAGDIDIRAAQFAATLLHGIHRASYQGINGEDRAALEEARKSLYSHLEGLLKRAESEISRG